MASTTNDRELLLKRGLKRAKLFEVQRITKRIKRLRQKRGSKLQLEKHERKCDRLLGEIRSIKDIDLSSVAAEVHTNDHDADWPVTILDKAPPPCPSDGVLERMKWRLLNSKAFRDTLTSIADLKQQDSEPEETNEGCAALAEETLLSSNTTPESDSQSDEVKSEDDENGGKEDSRTTRVRTALMSHNKKRNRRHITSSKKSQQAKPARDRRQNKITQTRAARTLKERARAARTLKERARAGTKSFGRGQDRSPKDNRRSSRNQNQRDCGRQRELRGNARMDRRSRAAAGISSMFVGLSSGRPRNPLQLDRPKNRMGQRARQRLWEDMYGSKANHLTKRKDRNALNKRTSKKRDIKSSRKGGNKRGRDVGGGEIDPELHPSWIASKQRKAQEKCLHKFEGKRTLFTDSD